MTADRVARTLLPIGAALFVALTASSVAAQPVEWIVFDRWEGELGLLARFEDETRERIASTDLDEEEEHFEERIGLRLDGSVYHPRLLEFDLYGALIFEQEYLSSSESATDVDRDSTDSEYDVQLRLLKNHDVSFRFGARQRIREVRQSFFQSTELTNTNVEAGMAWTGLWFPFSIEVRRDEVEGEGFRDTDERRDTILIQGHHFGTALSLDARAEYGENDIFTTDQMFRTKTAQASVRRRWGSELGHLVTATGYTRDQSGTIDTETSNASLSSRHRHSETLTTEVRVIAQESRALGAENSGLSEEFTVTHQLYESLTSTLTAGAAQDDFDGGTSDSIHGGVDLRYRKRIPGGTMHLGLSADREVIDEEGLGTIGSVVDEPQVFTFGIPIFLDRTFIDATSIIVTDAAGTFVYTEGTDYVVSAAGELTRIDIPVTSLINSGDTLLFTYTFLTSPDRSFRRDRTAADLSFELGRKWNLYGRISRLDEELEDGVGSSDLDDVRRSEVGVVWGDARRRASLRYTDLDSRFNPVERLQGSASISSEVSWLPWPARGTARLDLFRSRFPDEQETERGADAVARLDVTWRRGWSGRAFVEYRWLDDRIEESTGFLGELGVRYGSTAWTLDAILRKTVTDFDISTDEDRTRFELRLVRRFGGRFRR